MGAAGSVLVVCTGNVCRSPYIERALRARLEGTGVEVTSAGTHALVGDPMDAQSAERLVRFGGDPEGFAARQITPQMVVDADLVITAAREHRKEVVQLEPKGLRRTVTLLDLADLVHHMPFPLPPPSFLDDPNASGVARLVSAAHQRRASVPARQEDAADVVDPFRRPSGVFDEMARQIDEVLPTVVEALAQAARG